MKVVRMQSISRQAGSVGSHQAQKEKWSILYRRHPGMGPSLDWAGARRGFHLASRSLRLVPVSIASRMHWAVPGELPLRRSDDRSALGARRFLWN
jgi:hypothetical protein